MNGSQHQPDIDRLSTLAALVLLVYGLVRILSLPTLAIDFAVLGVVIPLTVNTRLIMLILAASLSVIAADWLVASHPLAEEEGRRYEAWILPGLAALAIGGLVTRLPEGPLLWLGLILAAAALIAVLIAEYLVTDRQDPRYPFAARGLEALAYLLILEGLFTLRASNVRAVFLVPASLTGTAAVSWRLLRLWLPERRSLFYAVIVGWFTSQLAWGLHYWPLLPAQEALLLLLLFYVVHGLIGWHLRAAASRARVMEYALVGGLGTALVILLG